jgi:hypothetical protein
MESICQTEDAPVVRVENAVPCPPETRFAPDGLRYSRAEFENYFDAETAGATKHAISKNDYHSNCDSRFQTMFLSTVEDERFDLERLQTWHDLRDNAHPKS